MYDNLGNGWGSGFYRIKNSLGITVSVGTLSSGAYSQDTLCLPSEVFISTVYAFFFVVVVLQLKHLVFNIIHTHIQS